MNEENSSPKDTLIYLLFAFLGVILVLLSFLVTQNAVWSGLLLNIGATLISTSLLFFLYQSFSTQNLVGQISAIQRSSNQRLIEEIVNRQSSRDQEISKQIAKIQDSLSITNKTLNLGICDMWRERGDIRNEEWNEFVKPAHSEVWLFGIAEYGYAKDRIFHQILSDGTAQGCRYRVLLLDPNSAAAKNLDFLEGGTGNVQGRISDALKQFQKLKEENDNKKGSIDIRVCDDIPHVNIVRADSELLVTQYMPPLLGYDLFTIRVRKIKDNQGIFSDYEEYFQKIWERSLTWQDKEK